MVREPEPALEESVTHHGFPVIVHAPLAVILNVLVPPTASKLISVGDMLNVLFGACIIVILTGVAPETLMVNSPERSLVIGFG